MSVQERIEKLERRAAVLEELCLALLGERNPVHKRTALNLMLEQSAIKCIGCGEKAAMLAPQMHGPGGDIVYECVRCRQVFYGEAKGADL